jgi:hypothetical protein
MWQREILVAVIVSKTRESWVKEVVPGSRDWIVVCVDEEGYIV